MGSEAIIIAIGSFSKQILPALEYPAEFYKKVEDGAVVITCVFEAFGSHHSEELARCFGVGNWDLGRHELDASRADIPKLRQFEGDSVDQFIMLRNAGFKFYYMPRG